MFSLVNWNINANILFRVLSKLTNDPVAKKALRMFNCYLANDKMHLQSLQLGMSIEESFSYHRYVVL